MEVPGRLILAGLVVGMLLIVPALSPATSSAPVNPAPSLEPEESGPAIPSIDRAVPPSDGLNIGPGWPAAIVGDMNFTVILREPINGTVKKVYLVRAKLGPDNQVMIIKSGAPFVQVNETAVKLIRPAAGEEPGLYDLIIETSTGQRLVVPRSIWIVDLNKIAEALTFEHITDVHFGAGTPNITIGQYRRYVGYLMSQLLGVDMIINTGDEADTASANQYMNSLAYRYIFAYEVPMYLNPGNHDYPNKNFIKYYGDTVRYMVIGDRILIVALNTDGEVGHPDNVNMTFLQNVLEEYKNIPVKIVIFHHPVFYYQGKLYLTYDSNSSLLADPNENRGSALSFYWGADVNMTRWFLRLVEEYNVTMVLAGHIHRDQYVEYHSTRTGSVTYFQTTTTLAHGTGTYQGFQVVRLNLTTGTPSYPYAPPWFIGYENHSRKDVYNSIPVTLPNYAGRWKSEFGNNYLYGEIHQGKTALVMSLYNYMPNIDINRTVILSLPWPEGYDPGLKILEAENGSVSIVSYLYDQDLGRLYIALHYNLPHKSMVKFALYTEPDHEPPIIKLKRTLPRNPAINRVVKAYITVEDSGWGVESVSASAVVDRGTLEKFELSKLGENTYIAEFKVNSNFTANITITVTATDYAGNTNTSTITINLAGPAPPPQETTTTTPSMTTTSPPGTTTTTTPPAGGETTTTTTTTTPPGTTSPAQPAQATTETGGQTGQGGGSATVIAVIIIVVLVLAGIYVLRKQG